MHVDNFLGNIFVSCDRGCNFRLSIERIYMQDFVHLHVHTQYSLLDGQASVSRLVDKAMKDGMKGIAVTDHALPRSLSALTALARSTREIVSPALTFASSSSTVGVLLMIPSKLFDSMACGYALRATSVHRRKRPDIIDCVQYSCNNYARNGNGVCTAHNIEARDLFNAVLADINRFADMAVNDEKAVKRSARIALRWNGILSFMRPAAGEESCRAGFYFQLTFPGIRCLPDRSLHTSLRFP